MSKDYTQRLLRTVDAWERLIRQLPRGQWEAEIAGAVAEIAKHELPAFVETCQFALEERLLKNPRSRGTD